MEIVVMPKLGFNMDEGKLVTWHKDEGSAVVKGEALFTIETDKTNIDVEATHDGVVRKLLVSEGEAVPVTLPIAIIADEGEDIAAEVEKAYGLLGRGGEAPAAETSAPAATPKSDDAPKPAAAEVSGRDFDIFVVGGGPGGYVAAIKAAQMGKKVAIAEKDRFGGVCLNRGCIPTKTLLRSVEALKEVKEHAAYGVVGVNSAKAALDMKQVQTRKLDIAGKLVGGVEGLLAGNGATVLRGEAKIVDRYTVEVAGKSYSADYIIIATGSEVKSLPEGIVTKKDVLTSDEMLALDHIPSEVTIIGGGVIGVEFAYFLAHAGAKVTIVEFMDRILPMVDKEITELVRTHLESEGIVVKTGAKVTKVADKEVQYELAGATETIKTDNVFMAVGRAPSFAGIDTEKLGIRTDRGAIVTDESLRTSVDNIYAIGDVNGRSMLAHTASMEGIVAVENISGGSASMNYDAIPTAIYIKPEIASVGLTEEDAIAKYGDVKVGRFPLLANGKSKVEGDERGLIKVVTEAKYGEILGVHLYCIHATDMIAEAVTAMNAEATAEDVASSIHPHPTVSEAVQEAFHAALGRAIHYR